MLLPVKKFFYGEAGNFFFFARLCVSLYIPFSPSFFTRRGSDFLVLIFEEASRKFGSAKSCFCEIGELLLSNLPRLREGVVPMGKLLGIVSAVWFFYN